MTFVDSHEVVYSLLERLREKSSVVNPEYHCCGLSGKNKKTPCKCGWNLPGIVENAARLLNLLESIDDEGTDEFPEEIIKDLVLKTHCRPNQRKYTLEHIRAWWESVKQWQDEQVEDLIIGKAKKVGRPGPPTREAAPVTPVKKQSRRPYQVTPDFSPSTVVASEFDDDRDLDYQDSGDEDSEAESDDEAIFDTEPDDPETPDTIPSLEGCKTRPIVIDDEPSPTRHRSKRADEISLSGHYDLYEAHTTKFELDSNEASDEEEEREIKPPKLFVRAKDKGKGPEAARTPLSQKIELKPKTGRRSFSVDIVTVVQDIVQPFNKIEPNDGVVYVLHSEKFGSFKVGFSTCKSGYFTRYSKKKCNPDFEMVAISTKRFPGAKRVEKLVHTELFRERRVIANGCPSCPRKNKDVGTIHDEWFEIGLNEVLECVRKWTRFVLYPAYDDGKLRKGLRDHMDNLKTLEGLVTSINRITERSGNDNLTVFNPWKPKIEFGDMKVQGIITPTEPFPDIPPPDDLIITKLTTIDNNVAKIDNNVAKIDKRVDQVVELGRSMEKKTRKAKSGQKKVEKEVKWLKRRVAKLEEREEARRDSRPALSDITNSQQLNLTADEREHSEQPHDGMPQARTQQRAAQTEKKSKTKSLMRGALDSGARGFDKLRSKVGSSKTEKAAVAPEQDSGPARGLRRRLTGGFSKTKRTATF